MHQFLFAKKLQTQKVIREKVRKKLLYEKAVCKIFCEIPSLMCFVSEFGGHDCRDDYIQEIPCNGSTPVQAVNETAKCYRKNFL